MSRLSRERTQLNSRIARRPHGEDGGAVGKSSLSDGLDDGQPLQYSQRSLFEKSLGQNLSDVRVHTNDAAAEKASLFNAKAYTAGRDIVFDKGQYDPGSKQGQH